MKEIIFVRHAKSDWGTEILKDIDRCLSDRGYSDAYMMSKWYTETKKTPQLILSSTATRALSTAFIFMRAFDFELSRFRVEPAMYECTEDTLLSVIKAQNDSISSLMLFGHNPGFTNVCNALAKEYYFDNIPTCGIVSFTLNSTSWKNLKLKTGVLNYHHFPKDYKNKG